MVSAVASQQEGPRFYPMRWFPLGTCPGWNPASHLQAAGIGSSFSTKTLWVDFQFQRLFSHRLVRLWLMLSFITRSDAAVLYSLSLYSSLTSLCLHQDANHTYWTNLRVLESATAELNLNHFHQTDWYSCPRSAQLCPSVYNRTTGKG